MAAVHDKGWFLGHGCGVACMTDKIWPAQDTADACPRMLYCMLLSMKGLLTVVSLLVSAALIWYTLEADQAHVDQEAQRSRVYMSIIEADLRLAAPLILKNMPARKPTATWSTFLRPQSRQQLKEMHRYNDELDALFNHHMQIMYLQHDGSVITVEAGGQHLLRITEAAAAAP